MEFTVRQDMETVLRCHINGFRYLKGVPEEVLYDNLKTTVDHREAGQVVWNRRLRDLADYYGFIPRACQPYRAQTKGKVESGIRYVSWWPSSTSIAALSPTGRGCGKGFGLSGRERNRWCVGSVAG